MIVECIGNTLGTGRGSVGALKSPVNVPNPDKRETPPMPKLDLLVVANAATPMGEGEATISLCCCVCCLNIFTSSAIKSDLAESITDKVTSVTTDFINDVKSELEKFPDTESPETWFVLR
jgi:hypothetical protein